MPKKIVSEFFTTSAGNEPVRDALISLGRPIKTVVGADILFVENNWRVDRPYVDQLRKGTGRFEESISEVRHAIEQQEYRTLFFVYGSRMILVHFFMKKTQKTPKKEIDVAWTRMKDWIRAQRAAELSIAKPSRLGGKKL